MQKQVFKQEDWNLKDLLKTHKGKEFNDVDILFITNQTKKTADFCLEISKIRTKPVVPLIMKQKDLIKAMKQKICISSQVLLL